MAANVLKIVKVNYTMHRFMMHCELVDVVFSLFVKCNIYLICFLSSPKYPHSKTYADWSGPNAVFDLAIWQTSGRISLRQVVCGPDVSQVWQ